MPLQTTTMTGVRGGQTPVPNAPSGYVPQIMQYEADLLTALAADVDDIELWLQAGGIKSADVGGAITEIDAAGTGTWTAGNTSLTRDVQSAVMGGRKRWKTTSNSAEGLRGSLSSNMSTWAGYTIIVPCLEPISTAANNCIFSVGTSGAGTRMTAFVVASGNLSLNNGTSGSSDSFAAGLVAGNRYSVMMTYDDSDGSTDAFLNSATSLGAGGAGAIDQSPPAETDAGILGSADDLVESEVYMDQIIVLRKAITSTSTIEAIMAACANIRTFA